VSEIEAVNLSPLVLETLERDGQMLTANPPLHLHPNLDEETQQLFVVEDKALDLLVFAFTREQLAEEVRQHVFFCWDAYAKEQPERLTKAAQDLRTAYLNRFHEVFAISEYVP